MWDMESKQELLELPRSGGCNFNAAWSPTMPGVFATASFDGKVWSDMRVFRQTQSDTSKLHGALPMHSHSAAFHQLQAQC